MLRVPGRLAGDRLADVRVDLGQRVIAGDPAKRVRQIRVDTGVVQRVTGLVEERLVVVQSALCPRDQVHDARRVGCDHAGARRFLGPVVEVEADVLVRGEVEAERRQRRETDVGRPVLRVRRVERREAAHVAHVRRRGLTPRGPGPSNRSNQRSRIAMNAPSIWSLAAARTDSSSRSEICFSSSLRATASGSSVRSASSSSYARSNSSRCSLNSADSCAVELTELVALLVVARSPRDGRARSEEAAPRP